MGTAAASLLRMYYHSVADDDTVRICTERPAKQTKQMNTLAGFLKLLGEDCPLVNEGLVVHYGYLLAHSKEVLEQVNDFFNRATTQRLAQLQAAINIGAHSMCEVMTSNWGKQINANSDQFINLALWST